MRRLKIRLTKLGLLVLMAFVVTACGSLDEGVLRKVESVGSKLTVPAAPMEVMLQADGTWTLEDKQAATPKIKVSLDELVARVKDKQTRLPDQPVVIAAGGDARYEEVIKVLDRLQTSGVRKGGLLARPTGR